MIQCSFKGSYGFGVSAIGNLTSFSLARGTCDLASLGVHHQAGNLFYLSQQVPLLGLLLVCHFLFLLFQERRELLWATSTASRSRFALSSCPRQESKLDSTFGGPGSLGLACARMQSFKRFVDAGRLLCNAFNL